MSDLAKRLTDLWELPEADRDKGVKLLSKVFNNILTNPNDPKFRDLNFSKIRKKLETCKPAFYLLFSAGFGQSVDGSRLQWQNNTITMKLLQEANAGLQAKINGEDVVTQDDGVIDISDTSMMKDRNMLVHRKKKEKKKLEKLQQQAEEQQLEKDVQKIEQMETEQAANTETQATTDNAAADVDEDEMQKALAMSMEQDGDGGDDNNAEQKPEDAADAGGDVAMADETGDADQSVASQLQDAGLSVDELALIEQIKAAKGITVTLKPQDLAGLSKEEKVAKFREVRDKYRKEQRQNEVKIKLDKERRRREGVKKAQEAERKRKEYEMRMLAGRKKREKAEAERRKKAIKEKIAADKKRRQEQKDREKRKKEAAAKAAKEQQENQ